MNSLDVDLLNAVGKAEMWHSNFDVAEVGQLAAILAGEAYYLHTSRFVEALGRPGDVLLAISTSGNSPNILRAAEAARATGMTVIGLTGKAGGKLADLSDVEIRVAHFGFADRIQEVHIKAIHIMIMLIEKLVAA